MLFTVTVERRFMVVVLPVGYAVAVIIRTDRVAFFTAPVADAVAVRVERALAVTVAIALAVTAVTDTVAIGANAAFAGAHIQGAIRPTGGTKRENRYNQ